MALFSLLIEDYKVFSSEKCIVRVIGSLFAQGCVDKRPGLHVCNSLEILG